MVFPGRADTGAAMPPAGRLALILPGLALVAASNDAICYLGLGHVFTANMTGNTVLLGIGVATGNVVAILRSATALGAFLLGNIASVLFAERQRALAMCLMVELLPLGAWYGWWEATGEAAHGTAMYGYIALAGLAMGLQSGAVTRLGIPGVTTTFITGTMTALTVGLSLRSRGRELSQQDGRTHLFQIAVLACYLAGALAGAYSFRQWAGTAVLVPVIALAVIAVAAFALPPESRR